MVTVAQARQDAADGGSPVTITVAEPGTGRTITVPPTIH